ncbi:hypothetical protein Poli38472_012369 [Pythium oligandrum]|uniref:Uncharacterized protein n=1 Tax=Pythium oligandrum TaxID=41045 RepID=A0A8K1CS03_PYTOL|nr:hypothetical protein Poli38472_012369 [Pythium oligandrum]|eukprot:TMW67253.1 hypothetical protein Poli38472_012369 [Pythium oligandrum]
MTTRMHRMRSKDTLRHESENASSVNDQVSNASQLSVLSTSKAPRAPEKDDRLTKKKRIRPPRKATYTIRKEEKQELQEELRVLTARMELIKKRLGVPLDADHDTLEQAQVTQAVMENAVRKQRFALSSLQSLLSSHLNSGAPNPLKLPIRLTKDMKARRETLTALHRKQLDLSHEFVSKRLEHIDITKPYNVEERYLSDSGDFHFARFEILHFENVDSVKQVFDALVLSKFNLEITISANLGHFTVREDVDDVDTRIFNYRLVSSFHTGIIQEMNVVNFAAYYDSFVDCGGQPYGLVIASSVDEDELHPYCPDERVRKDVTAALALTSFRRPRQSRSSPSSPCSSVSSSEDSDGELVVVMKRCSFLKIHRPQFEISDRTWEELQLNSAKWADLITKSVRDQLLVQQTRS